MTMLSGGQLASLRRQSEKTMEDRVQILRPVNTADAGGMVTTYSVVTVTHWSGSPTGPVIPCRVAPSQYQATERIIGGALQGSAQIRVTMPALTDVRKPDLLSIGSSLTGSGLTYAQVVAGGGRLLEALGVADPRTIEISRIVYANELG